MPFIRWTRPRGSVHDLVRILSLPDEYTLLCVSKRSLAILHDLAALDVEFESRYAVEKLEGGYISLTHESELYPLFLEVIRNLQLEVMDMGCDIGTGLEQIAQALTLLAQRSGGGGNACASGVPGVIVNCLADFTNDEMLPQPDLEVTEPTPPEGFDTWEEYVSYKCDASYFIWEICRKYMQAAKTFDLTFLTAQIVGVSFAGIAGLIPASLTPAGFLIVVTSILAIGVLTIGSWFWIQDALDWWEAHQQEIICELFNAGNSPEAVAALANALEDAIQAITFTGALAPLAGEISGLLGEVFGQVAGNGLVAPLFSATATIVSAGYDCGPCDQQEGDCDTDNHLVYGTGTLNVPGTSVITPSSHDGWYKIELHLKRGMCLKATAGPSGQEYKYYRCQNGSYAGPYKTQGAPDSTFSCCGKFTLLSDVTSSVTLVIGDDTCVDDDNECT